MNVACITFCCLRKLPTGICLGDFYFYSREAELHLARGWRTLTLDLLNADLCEAKGRTGTACLSPARDQACLQAATTIFPLQGSALPLNFVPSRIARSCVRFDGRAGKAAGDVSCCDGCCDEVLGRRKPSVTLECSYQLFSVVGIVRVSPVCSWYC